MSKFSLLALAFTLVLVACAENKEEKKAPAVPFGTCDQGFSDAYNSVADASDEFELAANDASHLKLKTACTNFFTTYPNHTCVAHHEKSRVTTTVRSDDHKPSCRSTKRIQPTTTP